MQVMHKANDPDKNAARIVGILFLIPIAFINNTILIGPYTFAKDYLIAVAEHSSRANAWDGPGNCGGNYIRQHLCHLITCF